MTDDLRRAMEAEVGDAAAPPVHGVWRSARQRARRRRAAVVGVPLASMMALVGVLAVVARTDRESIPTAFPRSCAWVERARGDEASTLALATHAPPADADDMANRWDRAGVLLEPSFVGRVRVVEVVDAQASGGQPGLLPTVGELTVTVEDAVRPRTIATRLRIVTSSEVWLADLAAAKDEAMVGIDELQDRIDELNEPLLLIDLELATTAPDDPRYQALLDERVIESQRTAPERNEVQEELAGQQQELQLLQLSERAMMVGPPDFACHEVEVGDELIVALGRSVGDDYHLVAPGSFFVIEDGELSPELDALRRSVPEWRTELVEQASDLTPEELLALLREAADQGD